MRNREMSKFMRNHEKKERAKKSRHPETSQKELEAAGGVTKEPSVPLGKTTRLVFFKQYNTYQALLAVYPREGFSVSDAFSKVVLYIMRWFKNRLGDDAFDQYPDIMYLKEDYPSPDDYAGFDIEKVANINGLDFIDFETAYIPDKNAWVVSLIEPDNGQEGKNLHGRTFTTEIAVYQQDNCVVLGIREGCREPKTNEEDAFGFRPGFVRDIFFDDDLIVGEQGLDKEYAFARKAYRLNGKSGEACRKLYESLIASSYRQMPVLFVPGSYYEKNSIEVDKKTESLLGYCHVVVWESTCRKLFEHVMENKEFVEVAEEGQLIFYRTTSFQSYPADYYEQDQENLMDVIKLKAQREPLRKSCDFREFSFKPSWWEPPVTGTDNSEDIDEIRNRYNAEIAHISQEVNNLKRDNDELQRRIDQLTSENKRLDGEIAQNVSRIGRQFLELEETVSERERIRDRLREQEALVMQRDVTIRGMQRDERQRCIPLINLPLAGSDKKGDILRWIKEYYSDVIEIHEDARKSFAGDNRNLDWHRFCMMIHYIAGYTRYRNDSGPALDPLAARDYDPEESGYKIEPAGSGQGALEFHKNKYVISIIEAGVRKEVLLDLHLKYGKGMDNNMIRIYFYYSTEEKKSFIGHMPGHLPTRKDAH